MRLIVPFLLAVFTIQPCLGWSELGHHPQFDDKFKIPDKAGDPEEWLIGRAAYWPDIARRSSHDRPNWHWQLGSSLTIGNVNPPENPGPCPPAATMDDKSLHIAQAVELCRRVLRDKQQPAADRAIALCWLCHLVGDAHQPCHSGSLYCPQFRDGDRGANEIPTQQRKNLHALWDSLLGANFDAGDLRRRDAEIRTDIAIWPPYFEYERHLDPLKWLSESNEFARDYVYTEEVLGAVKAASDKKLEPISLSEKYLKDAGKVAQKRAAIAALRLYAILSQDLKD